MNRLLISTLALSALLTTATFAEKNKGDGEKPRHRPLPGMQALVPPPLVEKLNLTADQKAELATLQKQFDTDRNKFRDAHQDEVQKLRADMKDAKDANDEAKVKALHEQLRTLTKPQMEARKSYMQKFIATLTPEQKDTLEASHKKMRERMKERHGDQPPPPPEE